jgi:hypothetical protein
MIVPVLSEIIWLMFSMVQNKTEPLRAIPTRRVLFITRAFLYWAKVSWFAWGILKNNTVMREKLVVG